MSLSRLQPCRLCCTSLRVAQDRPRYAISAPRRKLLRSCSIFARCTPVRLIRGVCDRLGRWQLHMQQSPGASSIMSAARAAVAQASVRGLTGSVPVTESCRLLSPRSDVPLLALARCGGTSVLKRISGKRLSAKQKHAPFPKPVCLCCTSNCADHVAADRRIVLLRMGSCTAIVTAVSRCQPVVDAHQRSLSDERARTHRTRRDSGLPVNRGRATCKGFAWDHQPVTTTRRELILPQYLACRKGC